jgi:hypothetical protein
MERGFPSLYIRIVKILFDGLKFLKQPLSLQSLNKNNYG